MALTTQLRVLIEGDASGLIGQLSKAGRASSTAFSEVSRSAKAEFAAATREADKAFKEVGRLQAQAKRADAAGQGGLANALRSQAAARAIEGDKAALAAVAAEKKIQSEMAKTAAVTNTLTQGAANQGGVFSRFFGLISKGSGDAGKNLTGLKGAAEGALSSLGGTKLGSVVSDFTNLGKSAGSAAAGLGPIAIAGTAAAVGIGLVAKNVDEGLKKFEEYAGQVRQVGLISGATAKESSLLAGEFRHFHIDVDSGSKALGIFAKNAKAGNLDKLGIDVAHFRNGQIDLVGTLANAGDAFKKYGTSAEGTNLTLKAFGRGGAVLIPILAALRGELKGIDAQTARQGLVFSQKEVDQAHDLSVATTDVHHSIAGLQITAAKGLAPIFITAAHDAEAFVEVLTAVEKHTGGAAAKIAQIDIKGIAGLVPGGSIISALGDHLTKTGEQGSAAAEKLKQAAEAGDEMASSFEASNGILIKSAQASLGVKDALSGLAKAFSDNGKSIDDNTDAGRKNITAALAVANAAAASGQAIAAASGNPEKGAAAIKRYNAELLSLLTTQLGSRDAAEKFAQKFGLIDAAGIKAASGVHLTAGEMAVLEKVTSGAVDELQQFNNELDKTTGKNLSASDANIRYHQSLAEVQKQLLTNGNTFDLNTKAGQDNASAVNAAIGGLEAYAKAEGDRQAALTGSADGQRVANSLIEQGRAQLIATLAPLVGGTAQATKYVDELLKIPPSVSTNVTFGKSDAERSLEDWLIKLANIPKNVTTNVGVSGLGLPGGGGRGRNLATGGPTRMGQRYQVGEEGAELWVEKVKGPRATEHLAQRATSDAHETLVRLGIPGGIEPKATHKGTPALLLGTQGPQTFTPPADGVVVNATDTKRLQRTDDPGIIERILKNAGLDKRSREALAATGAPGRAGGGSATKDRVYKTGEKGPELFVPEQKGPAGALTRTADPEARGALVRLSVPGGIEPAASRKGSPALLLGTHGPQMFAPPADGVVVNASDTKRLQRVDDAGIIDRILQRAGADRKTREALAATTAPARATGGQVEAGQAGVSFNPSKTTTGSITTPGVKRGADGSYNITIGDTHLKVEAGTSGSAKGVNKADVDKIVLKHQENLVAELAAAMRSG